LFLSHAVCGLFMDRFIKGIGLSFYLHEIEGLN